MLERCYPRWRRIKDKPEPYLRAALANAAANRWRRRSRRVREVPLTGALPPIEKGPDAALVPDETVQVLVDDEVVDLPR